jgi:hypothetical protein
MPTHKQLTVEVPNSTRGNGRSDTKTLQKAFPSSPIYSGELTDMVVQDEGQQLLVDGPVNDGGHTFGSFNRDYNGAPDLEKDVQIGGAGLPGSPYAPNIASPGEGHGTDPSNIPAEGAEATELAKGSGGPFPGNGLESPNKTSKNVSAQKLGSLIFGKSSK